MATGAVAMGKDVTLFLTFWGLMAFRKDDWKTNMRFSKDFEDYGAMAMKQMQAKKMPHWHDTLTNAMELGNFTIKACSLTLDLFDMKLEHLDPLVHEVTGVATFIEESDGGTTLFI